VQDDIAAMRGNFQHLAPLAQAVGELQVVSGLAPVVEELQAVSGLAPYITELLSSRIVDHNLDVPNPPNGHYVRWDNGLQVCWWTGSAHTHPRAIGPVYRSEEVVWTYPARFVAGPVVQVNGANFTWGSARLAATTAANVITFSPDAVSRQAEPSAKAIGVWK